jgi:hypothetical protein
MKEKPILFNGPMVVAVDDKRKNQTRRVMKPQPEYRENESLPGNFGTFFQHWNIDHKLFKGHEIKSPYGSIGDRLWVKENWRTSPDYDHLPPRDIPKTAPIEYIATDPFVHWGKTRPNIFMCRWMSRFLLEITDIRVERLNDISEEDAKAEGVNPDWETQSFIDGFFPLWNQINEKRGFGWDKNPWVWAVTFKKI